MSLYAELRRRNVIKVASLYLIASLLLIWLTWVARTQLGLPTWAEEFVTVLVVVGFPVALIFAWVYEITPAGLKKAVDVDQTQSLVFKTGQKLNAAIMVTAGLAVAALVVDQMLPELAVPPPPEPEPVPTVEDVADTALGGDVPAEIVSWTMANGLRVIVWPDHDIPNVAMYNFVRAGGRNEYPGITGVAHFFEHMMFNGTSRHDPGEFDRIMEANGGSNNAYTTNDITVYTDWFPRTALEVMFGLESDRFANLAFDDDVIESERGVVYSERRTYVDNDNSGRLYEQMYATAFVAHPYQFPVIGWPSDIEGWTKADLRTFYRRYYAPNNCTLVIVGDVTPGEIFRLAENYFGPIAPQAPPPPIRTVEPEQSGERRLLIETDAQTPLVHVAFHGGRAGDPDTLAMELLLTILADGDSSRLHRRLVEDDALAISVGGYQQEGFDPGLVYFDMTLPPDGNPAAAEAALFEELAGIAADGVTEAELAKAKNVMLADFWRQLATISGKAQALGTHEVFYGGYEALFAKPRNVDAITVDALKALAGRVFSRQNATIGLLRPPAAAPGDAS
ncbi:MAG: pitrilysin family protein [Woeseiaceae bacterium]|jgi:zinc protease|nr:pitrilysin family protein [Woeseiaceae bacterium]